MCNGTQHYQQQTCCGRSSRRDREHRTETPSVAMQISQSRARQARLVVLVGMARLAGDDCVSSSTELSERYGPGRNRNHMKALHLQHQDNSIDMGGRKHEQAHINFYTIKIADRIDTSHSASTPQAWLAFSSLGDQLVPPPETKLTFQKCCCFALRSSSLFQDLNSMFSPAVQTDKDKALGAPECQQDCTAFTPEQRTEGTTSLDLE